MEKRTNWRPHFGADAMRATMVEPTIQIGSYTYVGRLHSAVEWLAWNERLQDLRQRIETSQATGREVLAFYHAYFRDVFRPGLFRRGVPFWAPDVADTLLEEPFPMIEEAFQAFFARQAQANGVEVPNRKSPSTTGIDSSASTPGVQLAGAG